MTLSNLREEGVNLKVAGKAQRHPPKFHVSVANEPLTDEVQQGGFDPGGPPMMKNPSLQGQTQCTIPTPDCQIVNAFVLSKEDSGS